MDPYKIFFYLYCDWSDFPQAYRIYYNDELMTERDYIWDNSTRVLQEMIPLRTSNDQNNTIIIEHVGLKTGNLSVAGLKSEPPGLQVNVKVV